LSVIHDVIGLQALFEPSAVAVVGVSR